MLSSYTTQTSIGDCEHDTSGQAVAIVQTVYTKRGIAERPVVIVCAACARSIAANLIATADAVDNNAKHKGASS